MHKAHEHALGFENGDDDDERGPGVPGVFQACCLAASRGGQFGCDHAGYKLYGQPSSLVPRDVGKNKWQEDLNWLRFRLRTRMDADALCWFDGCFPRCTELVPLRRWQSFLPGFHQAFAGEYEKYDEAGEVAPEDD